MSSGSNHNSLTALKPVLLTRGPTPHVASSAVPSVREKHGRPLSAHCGQHLLVKGFTFSQIQKRVGKVASGCVRVDGNGYSKKAFVTSETVASPNSDDSQESRGAKQCARRQKMSIDGLLLNGEHVAMKRKCGKAMQHQCDSGDTVRVMKRAEKTNDVVGYTVDANRVVARRRGRPPTRPLTGASLRDGRMSVIVKCHVNRNAETEAVRRRGRPRSVPVHNASLTGDSVVPKSDGHRERGGEIGNDDELDEAREEVTSSAGANTVPRKRGRPRKRTVDGLSSDDKKALMTMKCGLQQQCGAGAAVVRKRGRPRKRPADDSLSSGVSTLTGESS